LDGGNLKHGPQHTFFFVFFFFNLAVQISNILECDLIPNLHLRKTVQSSNIVIHRQEKSGSQSFAGSGLHLLLLYSETVQSVRKFSYFSCRDDKETVFMFGLFQAEGSMKND